MTQKAIIAFVPVLHKGYLDFFSNNEGDIFILSQNLIDSFVHLTRDLRTIDPEKCVLALKALSPERNITTVDNGGIVRLSEEGYEFLMPEDEISHDIASRYIKNNKVTYLPVFLRWNRLISLAEHNIPAHRKITKEDFHRTFIKIADQEAAKSADWWRQIGSVIVKNDKILFSSHNHHLPSDYHLSTFGDPRSNFDAGQHQEIFTSIHSEASIIAKAAHDGVSLDGSTLYVTTYPCPNCARLISKAGIKKVYYSKGYSLLDAEKILDHFGIEVFLVQ